MKDREAELIQLKNLGIATVNILNAIGIHNHEDLKNMGPAEAYVRIKQRGIHVSKVMLYALQGALDDTHWNDLTEDTKTKLVQHADDIEAAQAS